MNFYELLTITDVSIVDIEEQLGRSLSAAEKVELVKGAINKWNEMHPDSWIVIPAGWNK